MITSLLLGIAMLGRDPIPGAVWSPVTLQTRAGKGFEWRPGRVTVMAFYALWCDTWKVQVPRLEAAKKALSGLQVDFLAISMDGRWQEVAGSMPILLDPGATWSHGVGVDRVPTTVVLDPEGRVRWVRSGTVRSSDVIDEVRKASGANAVGGKLFLTFDDFPPKSGGDELLDCLRAQGVSATLFCLGSRVDANSALLKRALREGHELACHSWSHDAQTPDLARCSAVFKRVLGLTHFLYRPPGSETIVGAPKRPIVDPYDYQRPGRDEVLRRVLLSVQPGAVLQLHAGVVDTLEALPEILENLRGRGFSFEKL